MCFGEDGITQGLPNVERGIGALSAALVPELECVDSEQEMKIKPQSKPFLSKTSSAREALLLQTPGNPLAWQGVPAAVVSLPPAATKSLLPHPSPPGCDSAFSHLSHLPQRSLLSTISTNTMSYDIEPGARRIPTLVQYCQRGEDTSPGTPTLL